MESSNESLSDIANSLNESFSQLSVSANNTASAEAADALEGSVRISRSGLGASMLSVAERASQESSRDETRAVIEAAQIQGQAQAQAQARPQVRQKPEVEEYIERRNGNAAFAPSAARGAPFNRGRGRGPGRGGRSSESNSWRSTGERGYTSARGRGSARGGAGLGYSSSYAGTYAPSNHYMRPGANRKSPSYMEEPNDVLKRLDPLPTESKREEIILQIERNKAMMNQNKKKQEKLAAKIPILQSKINFEASSTARRNHSRKMKRSMRAIDDLTLRNNRIKDFITALQEASKDLAQ